MIASRAYYCIMVPSLLAGLALSPSAAARAFLPPEITPETVSEAPHFSYLEAEPVGCVAVVTGRTAQDRSEKVIAAHMRVYDYAKATGLKMGPGALEMSMRYENADGTWVMQACRSLQALPESAGPEAADIAFKTIPAGRAVQALHRGSHETIKTAVDKVEAFISANRLSRKGPLVEYHFNHKPPEEEHLQISVVTVYVD